MVESLGSLAARSWAFTKKHVVPLLLAAVIAGLVLAVFQTYAYRDVARRAGGFENSFRNDSAQMQELQRRMQAGDATAAQELQNILVSGAVGGMMRSAVRASLAMAVVVIILSVLYQGFVLLLVLHEGTPPRTLLSRLPRLILPLIGLSLWVLVRTFVWIPFIGIITAIILGPRFALASLILVKDNKGVFASASESYGRTNGFWGKIIGNMIVVSICVGILALIVNMILGAILGDVAVPLVPIVQMAMGGYIIVFMAFLSLSILSASPQRT